MTNRKILKGLALLATAAIATGAIASRNPLAPPAAAKLAPSVLKLLDVNSNNIPILVKLKAQADLSKLNDTRLPRTERLTKVYDALRTVAQDSQTDLVKLLSTRGTKIRRYYIYNMIAVWGANEALIKELAARDDVEKIFGNPTVKLSRPVNFSELLEQVLTNDAFDASKVGDNIAFLKADQIWAKYGKAGDGIVVAGQDTGVEYDHPALVNHYRGTTKAGTDNTFNWHDSIHKDTAPTGSNDCGFDLDAPCDDGDHGSHTMGTMIGSDGGDNQIGMAPKAQWIACRNMDGGNGTPATYLECFEWLLAPYAYGKDPMVDGNPAMAPHIVNNSWGCPSEEGCTGDEFVPALKAMKTAGIMIVVSAGNDGPGCSTIKDPPAYHSGDILSVGAYDHRAGTIASFSSRGPSTFDGKIGPDVVAPGVNIRSSVRGHKYDGTFWSGTSMAGPHVAGAVALLWSIRPELIGNIDGTIDLLHKSADPKTTTQTCGGVSGSAIPNNTYGYGLINVMKAIEMADGHDSDDRTPTPPTPPAPPAPSKPSSTWPSITRR